jgi:hypothetical protein
VVVSSFTPIRVRSGGAAYTDSLSQVWSADTGFSGGSTFSSNVAIAGTADQPLYRNERFGNFSYNFSVPNGSYTVTLKFAEIYQTAVGARRFNVAINGQTVLPNFDILAEVAPKTALDKAFNVSVTNGSISIAFTGIVKNPKVSAIQIVGGAPFQGDEPAAESVLIDDGPSGSWPDSLLRSVSSGLGERFGIVRQLFEGA